MATRPATGSPPLAIGDAIQFAYRRGREQKDRIVICWLALCSDWTRSAGRYCRCMLLVPVIVVAAARVRLNPSRWRLSSYTKV
jgi:hypothetical protein